MVSAQASPLNEASDPHGAHVARLSSALCGSGHDVTVYTRCESSSATPGRVRTGSGYDVVHVPAGPARPLAEEQALPHIGAFAQFLLHEWAAAPPDVVHGHLWASGMVSVLGGRRIRVPVVQTFHSLAAAEMRHSAGETGLGQRGKVEVLVGKEAAHVAAVNSDEVAELIKAGVSRAKITLVPGGVDIDAFIPEGSRTRRDRLYRVVTAGPLLPHQDVEAVITALSKVDEAELVVAGLPESGRLHDDPEVARLKRHAEHLGVGERVVFAGAVPHSAMPALLRSADAAVCASSYEPSGAFALEAMACGVPVVATRVGGLADVVVHGVTGLLVPPGEPESLSWALRSLLLDDTLRNEFGVAGRDRVTARYSWSRVAADVLRVYERAGAVAATTVAAHPAW
ncbi:MAG TPA: glycosyltransferase [Lentzea sp.]|nr:glycosyltransferase [Lentzea sp.]HUQ61657.1 glycosyltransferase [Lentzea sp.]